MSDEPWLQFVDTNVLVYAHDATAGEKHERSKLLISELWVSRLGHLSVQVLQELYVTLTKKVPSPLDPESATKILQNLSHWRVHVPNPEDVLGAIHLQQRHQLSFWDAMILWSANQLDCEVVWSEDFNHGQVYDRVMVKNPFIA